MNAWVAVNIGSMQGSGSKDRARQEWIGVRLPPELANHSVPRSTRYRPGCSGRSAVAEKSNTAFRPDCCPPCSRCNSYLRYARRQGLYRLCLLRSLSLAPTSDPSCCRSPSRHRYPHSGAALTCTPKRLDKTLPCPMRHRRARRYRSCHWSQLRPAARSHRLLQPHPAILEAPPIPQHPANLAPHSHRRPRSLPADPSAPQCLADPQAPQVLSPRQLPENLALRQVPRAPPRHSHRCRRQKSSAADS